jgi:hypothetical protein
MAIALHGNLRDFGIGEVFQLIGQQRKTGVLQVRGAETEVELRFEGGCVVAASPVGAQEDAALGDMLVRCGVLPRERFAEVQRQRAAAGDRLPSRLAEAGVSREQLDEIQDLLTRETLFELLRWDDGSFRFVAQPVPHERAPDSLLGAEQVLMDGLRMVDEWRVFESEIPAESATFRRRSSLEDYRRSPAARASRWPAETERVLLLIDGRSSVRRVIDLSRLGTFLGMRILVDLARSGWIEPVRTRESRAAEAAARGEPVGLRRWALHAGPLAALLLLAVLTWLPRGAGSRAGAPLHRDPLVEARTQFETARLRHLVLAERLARGRWPAALDEVLRWPEDAAGALTQRAAGAYYLAQGERGPLVLAPER